MKEWEEVNEAEKADWAKAEGQSEIIRMLYCKQVRNQRKISNKDDY